MTVRAEQLIDEISQLPLAELEVVLAAILKRMDRQRLAEAILDEYIGIGEGVWPIDAQQYVEGLRREDEFNASV